MTIPHAQPCWAYFELENAGNQRAAPLDALAQWKDKAKARVEWQFYSERQPDNSVVHFATPIRE